MNEQTTIQGRHAISYATYHNIHVAKYADPMESARIVTIDEAREIAREDDGLVYLVYCGWSAGASDTYHYTDYFDGDDYLGPDEHGVYPIFSPDSSGIVDWVRGG